MRYLIIVCAIFFNVSCYVNSEPTGVGAYAYQDSNGNRYGGTYDLNDADFRGHIGGFPGGVSEFFPEYFKNLQSLLPEVFNDVNHQNLAFNAARKAFDITSNHAVFAPNFPFTDDGPDFSGFGQLPGFNMFGNGNMPGYSAFAGGMASPDYAHQVAGINPQNPSVPPLAGVNRLGDFTDFMHPHNVFSWITRPPHHISNILTSNVPNVNVVNRFGETAPNDGRPHFVGVSSSSYSTSSNINGKEYNQRGAHTVVNRDGKVTEYKVQN